LKDGKTVNFSAKSKLEDEGSAGAAGSARSEVITVMGSIGLQ
jgi:hypothetical protein